MKILIYKYTLIYTNISIVNDEFKFLGIIFINYGPFKFKKIVVENILTPDNTYKQNVEGIKKIIDTFKKILK